MANTIYVNWKERIIITSASELEKLIEKHVEELKSEITFNSWLDDYYCASEVFDMDEGRKYETYEEYEGRLREEAISNIREQLIPYEIPEYVKIDLERYF